MSTNYYLCCEDEKVYFDCGKLYYYSDLPVEWGDDDNVREEIADDDLWFSGHERDRDYLRQWVADRQAPLKWYTEYHENCPWEDPDTWEDLPDWDWDTWPKKLDTSTTPD